MKSFSLLILFSFVICITVYSQIPELPFLKSKIENDLTPKTPGDTLYQYDFNDISGWTFGFWGTTTNEWHVGEPTSNMADYTGDLSEATLDGTTPLTSGDPLLYIDGITFLLEADYQETHAWAATPAHDFSGTMNVLLSWKQIYKGYNGDSTLVGISTDGGMTISTIFEVNETITVAGYGEYEVSYDISSYAAGESNVVIYFIWYGPEEVSGQGMYGGGYGWQIDDVNITEAYGTDLAVSGTQINMGYSMAGYYSLIPTDQIMDVWYETSILNAGVNSLSNVTANIQVNSGYWSDQSSITSLDPEDEGEILIGPFTPEATTLVYNTTTTVSCDETEENPIDNVADLPEFRLCNGVMARDYNYTNNIAVSYYGGGSDGDFFGIWYLISNDDELNSIAIYIDTASVEGSSARGFILSYDYDTIFQTEEYIVSNDVADYGAWVKLALTGSDLGISGGNYIVGVELFGDILLGADEEEVHNWQYETAFRNSGTWYYIASLPMIRLNFAGYDSDIYVQNSEISQKQTINIYPNPSNGIINVDSEDAYEVIVYSLFGQMIKKSNNSEKVIDLSNLEKGLYIIEVITDREKVTKKVILH